MSTGKFCLFSYSEVNSTCQSLPNQPIKVYKKHFLPVWYLHLLIINISTMFNMLYHKIKWQYKYKEELTWLI